MKPTRVALWLAASALGVTIACASDAPGSKDSKAPRVSPEVLAKGRGLYKSTCAPCHGDGGKGDGPAGKIFKPPPQDHTNAVYMDTLSDEEIAKIINMGGAIKGKPSMPSHPAIRGEEMNALIAHIRSLSHPVR